MSLKTFQQNQESGKPQQIVANLKGWWFDLPSNPASGAPCHSEAPLSKAAAMPIPKSFSQSGPLIGTVKVPGDKSISHRSLMLSALAIGESVIEGLLE